MSQSKTLSSWQAQQIREGILVARRNYHSGLEVSYDAQKPTGGLRHKAYARTWVRELYGNYYFPPKASSTKRKPKTHGPSSRELLMDPFRNSYSRKVEPPLNNDAAIEEAVKRIPKSDERVIRPLI